MFLLLVSLFIWLSCADTDQGDNKVIKDQLTEQLAKERAKAAILAARAEKKRLAEAVSGEAQGGPSKKSRKEK